MTQREQLSSHKLHSDGRGKTDKRLVRRKNSILRRLYRIQLKTKSHFQIDVALLKHGDFTIYVTFYDPYLRMNDTIVSHYWSFGPRMFREEVNATLRDIREFLAEDERVETELEEKYKKEHGICKTA